MSLRGMAVRDVANTVHAALARSIADFSPPGLSWEYVSGRKLGALILWPDAEFSELAVYVHPGGNEGWIVSVDVLDMSGLQDRYRRGPVIALHCFHVKCSSEREDNAWAIARIVHDTLRSL